MVDRQVDLPVGARVALLLLVVAALVPLRTSAGRIVAYLRTAHPTEDAITVHDRRLAPMREALMARGIAEVGYLARTPLRADLGQLSTDPHYLASRYALAPVRLLPDTQRPWVFADLAVEPEQGGGIPPEFEVAQRLGDRLVLLRRRE